MPLRAALFDLDGTLVDSLADIAHSANHALAAAGYPTHPVAAYRTLIGQGIQATLRRAAPEGADVAALSEVWAARYTTHCTEHTRPYPGIDRTLTALQDAGWRLAVLSNKPDPFTQQIVAALFPAGTFAFIAGDRPDTPRKPDPTSAFAALRVLDVAPTEAAFIGDTPVDLHTARAAGTVAIAVSWGFRDRSELTSADAVIDQVPELAPALLAWPQPAR